MKLISGLKSNADKIGYVAGILAPDSLPGGDGLTSLISSLQQIMAGQIHAPSDIYELQNWASNNGKTALLAYAAGLVLDAVNIPMISQFAKPLQKGAVGFALTSGGNALLWTMTHSNIKGKNIINDNFSRAPTMNQAQMMYY